MPVRAPTYAPPGQAQRRQQRIAERNLSDEHVFYVSAAWRKVRALHLAAHPLCVWCASNGEITAATTVDHILPMFTNPELRLSPENLRSGCTSCHSKYGAKRPR